MFGQTPSLGNIFYPIGYPLFIMIASRLFPVFFFSAVAILQSLLGTISIVLLYIISKKLLAKEYSILFLIILASYYPWIDFGGYLMSETLATMLLTAIIFITFFFRHQKNRLWLFLFPILIGLASLARANLLITGVILAFWLSYQAIIIRKNINILQIIRNLIVIFCGVSLVGLLTIFLYYKYGGLITPTSLNGGFVFMEGQCLFRGATDSNGWSFGPPVFTQRNFLVEKTFDQPFTNSSYFYGQGVQCLLTNPLRIFQKPLELYYLFFDNVAWPSSNQPGFDLFMRVSHSLFNIFILPGVILAFYFYLRNFRKSFSSTISILILSLVSLFATTIVYHADIRYRLPFDGIFILISLWAYQFVRTSRKIKLPLE